MPEFEAGTFTIGTLIGILLGAFLGHALAVRRGKFQTKHNAAIEFRKQLMPAIIKIERGDSASTVITNTFQSHYEAAIEYSSYLNGKNLENFKSALSEYKNWHKVVCNRSSSEKLYGNDDAEFNTIIKIGPIKYINKLFSYAKT